MSWWQCLFKFILFLNHPKLISPMYPIKCHVKITVAVFLYCSSIGQQWWSLQLFSHYYNSIGLQWLPLYLCYRCCNFLFWRYQENYIIPESFKTYLTNIFHLMQCWKSLQLFSHYWNSLLVSSAAVFSLLQFIIGQ